MQLADLHHWAQVWSIQDTHHTAYRCHPAKMSVKSLRQRRHRVAYNQYNVKPCCLPTVKDPQIALLGRDAAGKGPIRP